MRLTVLGGSAAGPNIGAGCSGYLVSDAGTNVVLDLGPGTLLELRRHADFRQLDAVVVSHLHVDHLLDVLALRFALAYNPVRPNRLVPLLLPPGGLTLFDQIAAVFGPDDPANYFRSVFDVRQYDPLTPVPIGSLTLSFTQTVHYVPCWAIRVHPRSGGDLFYTADTGPAAALAGPATGAATLIAEAAVASPGDEDPGRGHLTSTEAGELASAARVERLVLSHLWQELGIERAMAEAERAFSGEVLAARPGLVVEW